jgi:hypothetical protein
MVLVIKLNSSHIRHEGTEVKVYLQSLSTATLGGENTTTTTTTITITTTTTTTTTNNNNIVAFPLE